MSSTRAFDYIICIWTWKWHRNIVNKVYNFFSKPEKGVTKWSVCCHDTNNSCFFFHPNIKSNKLRHPSIQIETILIPWLYHYFHLILHPVYILYLCTVYSYIQLILQPVTIYSQLILSRHSIYLYSNYSTHSLC